MWKNYLKTTFRTVWRQPGYSALNVGGLALGLACCFLIVLFIQHERSFDRFHEQGDRIYRLLPTLGDDGPQASTASGFAPDLEQMFPEVERAVRVENYRSPFVTTGGERRQVQGFAFADADFFEVFSFPLLRGNPATALENPRGVVLTESAAESFFPHEDPVGKTLTLGTTLDLTVTGVMADVPPTSHLQFNYLSSFKLMAEFMGEDALRDYTNFNYSTYLLLAEGADPEALEGKLAGFVRDTFGEDQTWSLMLQPLAAIHFDTGVRFDGAQTRDVRYLYVFGAIAAFLLVIACINFMNLATARAARRAKEVGLRKAIGAHRSQLVAQFLGESVLLSLVATVLALGLMLLALPFFNDLLGSDVQFTADRLGLVLLLLGIGVATGLLAGSYPAFYLSAFQAASVLKGAATRGRKAATFRKGLIVAQFAISTFLIVGTLVIYQQLDYMRGHDLGFDKEQVVFMPLVEPLQDGFEAFRSEVERTPGVVSVTRTGGLPGRVGTNRGYQWPGSTPTDETQGSSFWTVPADPGYLETMDLTLKAGRDFRWDSESDWQDTYILNEKAVAELGWEEPIGQPFKAWDRPEMGTVIGVVEDFHFGSLHQPIEPVVLNMKPWFSHVAVRLAPGDLPTSLRRVEALWQMFAPSYAFDYTFLDEDFERLYEADVQLAERFGFFAGVAIFIACLGLFGLAAFVAEEHRKEIGVRKVLGASAASIVWLLSKEFTWLVLAGFAASVPVAYLVMHRWLEGFAYHVPLGPSVFLVAGVMALLVAALTVSGQALRAAQMNPTLALRDE